MADKPVISPFDLIDTSHPYKEITVLASYIRAFFFEPIFTEREKIVPPLQPQEHVRLNEIAKKLDRYDRSFAEPPLGDWAFYEFAGPTEKWVVSVLFGLLPGHECVFCGREEEDIDAANTISFLNSLQNRVPLIQ